MSAVGDGSSPEKSMIGIGEEAHGVLVRLHSEGVFAEMKDAYRLGVAYALAVGQAPSKIVNRRTVFATSTLDQDGVLKLAVETLRPTSGESLYSVMEQLADWGVREIDRLMREEFLSLEDILQSVELGEKD